MKRINFQLILTLIALPVGLIIGLQISTVKKQHEAILEYFDFNVRSAVNETFQTYRLWNAHTSNTVDQDSYNSLYTNEEGSFSVMIAQTAQPYPLLDFEADTILPKIRKEQFLRFQKELEATRRVENPRLREFYIFRSIQYCLGCEQDIQSVADIFPLDSLARSRLKENSIETKVNLGFIDRTEGNFSYVSESSDTIALQVSELKYPLTDNEALVLYFPEKDKYIFKLLLPTLISSSVLMILSIICYLIIVRLLSRQKKLTQLRNDLINNITHEFKTPIATIKLALANIDNEHNIKQPKRIKKFTSVIKDENERLNAQVEKILQVRLMKDNVLQFKKDSVDIHEVIKGLTDAYSLKLQSNDSLKLKLEATQHHLTGDAFHLSNTISNLLDNAIKYSTSPRQISIETMSDAYKITISVKDNGLGISDKDQKLIFNQFYRVSSRNGLKTKGFGLGLSYVKSVVKEHEGTLEVTSALGEGSIFKISMPLRS